LSVDVTRPFSRRASAAFALFIVVVCTRSVPTPLSGQELADQLVGRLATVEPSARRVTIVPEGEVNMVELFVAADGELRQDGQRLTLAELVIQVGRRVSARYRVDGNRRIVEQLIVEPD
jgi:hypothetical protein